MTGSTLAPRIQGSNTPGRGGGEISSRGIHHAPYNINDERIPVRGAAARAFARGAARDFV